MPTTVTCLWKVRLVRMCVFDSCVMCDGRVWSNGSGSSFTSFDSKCCIFLYTSNNKQLEGKPMEHFIILEEGTLVRSKLSASEQDVINLQLELSRSGSISLEERMKHSVAIDTVEGTARVTGLLHSLQQQHKQQAVAYATVSARGPCKLWLVRGTDLASWLEAEPKLAMEMVVAMATELRGGTKSLQALVKSLKQNNTNEKGSGDALRVLCYDTTSWVKDGFQPAFAEFNAHNKDFEILMEFTPERLGAKSATYAAGYDAVCTFVNDTADSAVIHTLSRLGVKLICQRAAGFDRIDTRAALAHGVTVARVPAYSPYAVAEHAIALMMAVNRKLAKANNRVKMANFSLDSGLMGMDIHGKTVGVMGTGKIGQILCKIIVGFGAKLICYDVSECEQVKEMGGVYVSKEEILATSDVLFLMMPLLESTTHTINIESIRMLKKGVILVNTSRGGLIDTEALLVALREGIIKGAGMDVYENEADYFFVSLMICMLDNLPIGCTRLVQSLYWFLTVFSLLL
jgi:D-lactate dehydrogenase